MVFLSASGFRLNNFGLLAKKFRQVVKTEIYVPGRTLWRKMLFKKKNFFISFGPSAKKHWTFSRKISARLTKLQPICSNERFGEASSFSIEHSLFWLFRTFSRKVSAHRRNFVDKGLSKLDTECPKKNISSKTIFFWNFFNHFWNLCKRFSRGYSKLLFMCPKDIFE